MSSMATPFELIAQKLADLGIFSFFLPWLITAAVFWGLLKRSKIFDPGINAIIALASSFFLWGYLITAFAFEIGTPLSVFITQGFVFILVFVFGLVASSMFYPDFAETLKTTFKSRSMVWIFLGLFVGVLFFTSGLYKVLMWGPPPATGVERDVNMMVMILATLIVGILILVGVQRGMGEK